MAGTEGITGHFAGYPHENTTQATTPENNIATAESSPRATVRWKPDIYAGKFIPSAYIAVNASAAVQRLSPGVQTIDFEEYIKEFAGIYFLSPGPTNSPIPSGEQPATSALPLTSQNYVAQLMYRLSQDLEVQRSEMSSYNLFGVSPQALDLPQQIFSLHVPGIREGNPMVSYGDEFTLRQLRLDAVTGLPVGMAAWMTPGGGYDLGHCAPGFTGFQIHAVIMAVDMSQEKITFIANGVSQEPLVFNVCFSVQNRLIQSLERAMVSVGRELAAAHAVHDVNVDGAASENGNSPENNNRDDNVMPLTRGQAETQVREQQVSKDWLRCMLFPVETDGSWQQPVPPSTSRGQWVDLTLNEEQKRAIVAVKSKSYGSTPFLIYGPAGTGKTKTICEIVVQLSKDPTFHGAIILCAPSNSAADVLALRLTAQFKPNQMLRLNDHSRTFAEVPPELLSYCYVKNNIFNIPPFPDLAKYKIVITTCRGADILVQARVTNRDLLCLEANMKRTIHPYRGQEDVSIKPSLHWEALIVDEAAQATEPDLLIPLSVLAPPAIYPPSQYPIFVLAGDQHQLPPRTYNKESSLHISLFERLSSLPIYVPRPMPPGRNTIGPPFVKLIRNYRSHPAILAVPSMLFYEDMLIPESDTRTDSLHLWPAWRGRRWPVLFTCNGGIDTCEDVQVAGGSGWYNLREALKAIEYAKNMLTSGIMAQHEICIMSPFDTQVRLLRKMARANHLGKVNIGPVEAFQGLESRMVIFCTTRTRARFLGEDKKKAIGAMSQPQKFNVGITRAKEGLIVLGNPWVLQADRCWAAFLGFCWRNGLWEGEGREEVGDAAEGLEGRVNEWIRGEKSEEEKRCGLETALIRHDAGWMGTGARGVRGFMDENLEDPIWKAQIGGRPF